MMMDGGHRLGNAGKRGSGQEATVTAWGRERRRDPKPDQRPEQRKQGDELKRKEAERLGPNPGPYLLSNTNYSAAVNLSFLIFKMWIISSTSSSYLPHQHHGPATQECQGLSEKL